MKKWILLILGLLLAGCGSQEKVIDRSEGKYYTAEILSTGRDYGQRLKISGKDQSFTLDLSEINPWKVEFCNLDGGEEELAIGVFKESPLHKIMAKRVFFYNIGEGRLVPKYRMSRLSYPFDDFALADVDGCGNDELIALERTKDGRFQLGGYQWFGFVFERVYSGEVWDEAYELDGERGLFLADGENIYPIVLIEGELRLE